MALSFYFWFRFLFFLKPLSSTAPRKHQRNGNAASVHSVKQHLEAHHQRPSSFTSPIRTPWPRPHLWAGTGPEVLSPEAQQHRALSTDTRSPQNGHSHVAAQAPGGGVAGAWQQSPTVPLRENGLSVEGHKPHFMTLLGRVGWTTWVAEACRSHYSLKQTQQSREGSTGQVAT